MEFVSIISNIGGLIEGLAILVVAFSVVVFLYGLLKYVISDSPEKRSDSVKIIINGIIILFTMVSVWGLVQILSRTFNIGSEYAPPFENKSVNDLIL